MITYGYEGLHKTSLSCHIPRINAALAYRSTTLSVSGANGDFDGPSAISQAAGARSTYWMTSDEFCSHLQGNLRP